MAALATSTPVSTLTSTTALPTTSGEPSNLFATLTVPSLTTITASAVAGTTGLGVVDGTTLVWRSKALTLSDGVEVSVGLDGLEDSTTTARYGTVSVSQLRFTPGIHRAKLSRTRVVSRYG
jgi:hypothetical protein